MLLCNMLPCNDKSTRSRRLDNFTQNILAAPPVILVFCWTKLKVMLNFVQENGLVSNDLL